MNKFRLAVNVLAIAFFTFAFASLAQAQASRTWVSGVGDDANPCSRTAPCKTFAGAISKTASNGEINCLDPGGFGAVTITKPIAIICDGVTGGILASLVNGIIVNVPNAGDRVHLEGLDIEGFSNGLNGVRIITGGRVTIRKCSIRRFTGNAVDLAGTIAGARVYIIDSQLLSNGGGVHVHSTGGVGNFGTLINSTVDSNTSFAVQVTGAADKITLESSELTGSPAAINSISGGQIVSMGASNFLTGTGTPTSTLPLQ